LKIYRSKITVKEIRIHGRGGQGAVTAARMIASAFVLEGKYVASFPMYGFERRGAPVAAFTRVDEKPIREKTQVYTPDCMMVIDPTLMKIAGLFSGLKAEGILIVNSPSFNSQVDKNIKVAGVIDATKIAVEEIGRDIPNTCLCGAFAAVTKWVSIESILKAIADYQSGDMLKRNIRSAERGYSEVKILKWQ
jgi:2-oxoacid:acceptor oxidoreductase gamma subunit (pyruvate/2-ketoisovalerate family)